MVDAKPCPVCSGDEFSIAWDETDDGVEAYVMCDSCDEDVDTRGPAGKPCDTDDKAEGEAFRAWNHWVDSHRKQ